MESPSFVHLHVHSQYSILDGATPIKSLVAKAKENGMPAVALTDHGVMFGSKLFYDICRKSGVKPIIGCEAYVCPLDHTDRTHRSGHHLILLAKNLQGYKNLIRLVSLGHTEGFYYRPRIDKKLLQQYHEGLIVCSACIAGEIPRLILSGNLEQADEVALWYKSVFGDDFYLEVMLHPNNGPESTDETRDVYAKELKVTQEMFRMGERLGIKVVATNDVHFLNAEDADAHDILLCINSGKKWQDEKRLRYTRQEWMKTAAEMFELFKDHPEALQNTLEVAAKVEEYKLDSSPIMPVFPIPKDFGTEEDYRTKFDEAALREEFGERYDKLGDGGDYHKILRIKFEADYLQYLTNLGAAKRWPDGVPAEIQERIDFELHTIKTMGFPGYFLIVQDFIAAARDIGVIVGPGRGSAAGSVVAYCLGITGINPVKYDLLFERFLNPDRISMPDIDIDFDDEGRQRVLDWVTQKYGGDHVAHIVTFGSMAPKSAIKDVARVIELPLSEANRLAKLVPAVPKITMEKAYGSSPELLAEKSSENPQVAKTMRLAESLDGSVRQTGVHACGILISRDPLMETIPVMPTKDDQLLTTQYDGHFVEPIGLLKMDFLGLKTLSILKTCLKAIEENHGIQLDINKVSLEDRLTYDLFSRGETTALFQFESPGMKKHLRNLRPNRFEDLVAMNALYRPGPMEYISTFIKRKHGEEEIKYDHPMMEPYLNNTYGITVYQEQVMLQSRALGQFTRGESDSLRKAMGKKLIAEMEKLKEKFVNGCLTNPPFMEYFSGNQEKALGVINKIWDDWTAFAAYAFNKSHSVCYAYIAYQTGYLKAHYPVEFMAAVLTSELGNASKIAFLLQECDRMGIKVLPPDINRSGLDFKVDKGEILFGLSAIRGVGESASQMIIDARESKGQFEDLLDFCEKTEGKIGKKLLECLAKSGSFDCFGKSRSQIMAVSEDALKIASDNLKEKNSGQTSLFAFFGAEEETIEKLSYPDVAEWPDRELLEYEKELLGVYVSGHPIGEFLPLLHRFELHSIDNIQAYERFQGVRMGGFITDIANKVTSPEKKSRPWAILQVEGLSNKIECLMFPDVYKDFGQFAEIGTTVMIEGTIAQDEESGAVSDSGEEVTVNKKVFVKKLIPIQQIKETYTEEVHLRIREQDVSEEKLATIRRLCEASPGEVPIVICIIFENNEFAFMKSSFKISCTEHWYKEMSELLGKEMILLKPNKQAPDGERRRYPVKQK